MTAIEPNNNDANKKPELRSSLQEAAMKVQKEEDVSLSSSSSSSLQSSLQKISSNNNDNNNNGNKNFMKKNKNGHKKKQNAIVVIDEKLPKDIQADPRGDDPNQRITKKKKHGRNTESFDPESTLVRPDLRIHVGSSSLKHYNKPLKHDDCVLVPELFGLENDWTMYYKLIDEITEMQKNEVKDSEFISWHEGAHLIVKNPEKSSTTFNMIINRLCEYFHIERKSIGTRFNWYKDCNDWKPFHHDSAAFNPVRAKHQNITVGVSFGATRELAFLRANDNNNSTNTNHPCRIYFPQTNNGVFTFGRDVNIHWKHGINAINNPTTENEKKGRISIILWGKVKNVIEEAGSPSLLGSDGHGPHAASSSNSKHHHHKKNHHSNNGHNHNKHHHHHHSNHSDRNNNKNTDNNNNKNKNNDKDEPKQ